EEKTSAIMVDILVGIICPAAEHGVWPFEKGIGNAAIGVRVQMLCEHRHALVGPRIIAGMPIPVDHVLKFMCQRRIVILGAGYAAASEVDIDHLPFVRVLRDGTRILVLRGEVAADGA